MIGQAAKIPVKKSTVGFTIADWLAIVARERTSAAILRIATSIIPTLLCEVRRGFSLPRSQALANLGIGDIGVLRRYLLITRGG